MVTTRRRHNGHARDCRADNATSPAFVSTRGHGRIDYSDPEVMRRRAEEKRRQRELDAAGPWVVGRWVVGAAGVVHLEAVQIEPGYWVDDAAPLTTNLKSFARWRTRQGARQWFARHGRPSCRLVNLQRLLPPP